MAAFYQAPWHVHLLSYTYLGCQPGGFKQRGTCLYLYAAGCVYSNTRALSTLLSLFVALFSSLEEAVSVEALVSDTDTACLNCGPVQLSWHATESLR